MASTTGNVRGRPYEHPVAGKSRQITDRMVKDWGMIRSRVARMLPLIKKWEISCAGYEEAPDIKATWFIDPPYKPHLLPGRHTGGYHYFSQPLDYDSLSTWCKDRHGQVIVCEQSPADWLPFQPFRKQRNGVGAGTPATRQELMYYQEEKPQ